MRPDLDALVQTALSTTADLIESVLEPSPYKRRLVFSDSSFLDIYLSVSIKDVYAYHYERRHLDKRIYLVDNYPHHSALKLKTFPHHVHDKTNENVAESRFGTEPTEVLINFLSLVRKQIK